MSYDYGDLEEEVYVCNEYGDYGNHYGHFAIAIVDIVTVLLEVIYGY